MPLDLNPYPDFDTIPLTAEKLEDLAIDVAEKSLSALQKQSPDVNWQEIFDLIREEHSIVKSEGVEGFESRFKKENGDIDAPKLAAYERLALVKNTVRSYAPIMAERAHNTDTDAAPNLLRENIRQMKAVGFSQKDITKFFDQDAKISKSPTPHPTEGLSINGVKLACELVHAAEQDQEGGERELAIEKAIRDMVVSDDFGASHKFTTIDEAELSDFYAHNHNAGISALERTIEDAIALETGVRPVITLDSALRSWDLDSDGKNNAEGFAAMAKLSRTTVGSFNQIIDAIEGIEENQRTPQLQKFYEDCMKVKGVLQPIYDRSSEISKALADIADPKERQEFYESVYDSEYQDLKEKFATAYEAVGSENRGLDFYKNALGVMGDAVEALGGSNADVALPLDDALRLIRRTGFALEKMQPRQNDFENIDIIHNLFESESFRARGIFRADEFAEIDAHGGYEGLPHERQRKFLGVLSSYIAENGNRQDILEDAYAASPLAFDPNGNGYPKQARTILDRLELQQLYQLKFDQNIISDSQPGSDERMHFLFQLSGINNGTSMSLHEDRGTLPVRPQLLEEFTQSTGGKALYKTRGFYSSVLKGTPLDKTSAKDTWAIIHPASDAERGGGFGTRMETSDVVRSIAQLSYRSGVTTAQMLGGGMHITRFGGNPMLLFNTVAEELKDLVKKDGKGRFDRRVQEDRHIMRSATTMSFTEQGRHKRYNMATPMQVADDFSRKLSRMVAVRLDLEGLVEDHTFIAEKPEFGKAKVQKRMDKLWKKAIKRFNRIRFAVDAEGEIILDKLADKITTPHTIGFKNNGARPAAKGSGAKSMTGVRAIENAIRGDISETHLGGFMAAGQMMRDIVDDLKEERISFKSVKEWIDHPEWEFSVHGKCLPEAGKYNPLERLKDLGWADATFDELKEVGEQVHFTKFQGEKDHTMVYRGKRKDLSDEQVYYAKIWYERLVYVSHMEAALNGKKAAVNLLSDQDAIMASFRPEDNSPAFGLGPKTIAVYPDVAETLEENKKNAPQIIIQHMRERQIREDIEGGMSKADAVKRQGGEAQLRQSGATYRAGTAPHWAYWASKKRYGSTPKPPGFTVETVMSPKAHEDVARLQGMGAHGQSFERA